VSTWVSNPRFWFSTTYRVWRYDVWLVDTLKEEGQELHGLVDHDYKVIYIEKALPFEMRLTLMHEFIHVVEHHVGIELTEEEVIELEHGLVQLLLPWSVELPDIGELPHPAGNRAEASSKKSHSASGR